MTWISEMFIVGAQLLLGVLASIIGYVWSPGLLLCRWWRNRSNVGAVNRVSPVLSVFGIVSGLTLAVLGPEYLNAQDGWPVVLISLGGSLFFCVGMLWIVYERWGYVGGAVGLLGFAGLLHYIVVEYEAVLGPNPLLFKTGVLLALCESAVFLGISFATPLWKSATPVDQLGERIVQILSAILTLVEFLNIMFGFFSLTV